MQNSLTINLESEYQEKQDLSNIPDDLKSKFHGHFLMKHQVDTYVSNQNNDITINTFPTGTGKTKASLLHLLDMPEDNALIIAPTNELVKQHCSDARYFIIENKLSHIVIELNAKKIDLLYKQTEKDRRTGVLYDFINNPRNPDFENIIRLELKKDSNGEIIKEELDKLKSYFPIVIITNPDIFYTAIEFGYNKHDKRNIFFSFIYKFKYIVVDEFHYYNSKQLLSFLFFISIFKEFGYFNNNRKITILTATPSEEVNRYFNRFSDSDIRISFIKPQKVKFSDNYVEKTLSKIKLTFIGIEKYSKLKNYPLDFIKKNLDENKEGAIIEDYLYEVNDIINFLEENGISSEDIGAITGVVNNKDRNTFSKRKLIVATPTVDIGYNFEKFGKDRQNLDFLLFSFKYQDQFWQRLGRAGRVLGKTINDEDSEVICFVDNDILAKLKTEMEKVNNLNQEETISRESLREIIDNNNIFSIRKGIFEYITYFGFIELSKPINNLIQMFSDSERIKLDLVKSISYILKETTNIGGQQVQIYKSLFNRINKINYLIKNPKLDHNSVISALINETNFREELDLETDISDIKSTYKSIRENETEEKIEEYDYDALKEYCKQEIKLVENIYKFRDSSLSIKAFVYDPKKLMNAGRDFFEYDLFHILKGFTVNIFSSLSDFKIKTYFNKDWEELPDIFVQIEERLPTNLKIQLNLDLDSECSESNIYFNKLCTLNIGSISLKNQGSYFSDNIGSLEEINKVIKNHLVTMIVFKEDNSRMSTKIKSKLNYYRELRKFTCKIKNSVSYSAVIGDAAYFLASLIPEIRTEFFYRQFFFKDYKPNYIII